MIVQLLGGATLASPTSCTAHAEMLYHTAGRSPAVKAEQLIMLAAAGGVAVFGQCSELNLFCYSQC